MILANTCKSYYADILKNSTNFMTEFHCFAKLLEVATKPETRQGLATTTTVFSFNAMIGSLDHKVHFWQNLHILTVSTWGYSKTAYGCAPRTWIDHLTGGIWRQAGFCGSYQATSASKKDHAYRIKGIVR